MASDVVPQVLIHPIPSLDYVVQFLLRCVDNIGSGVFMTKNRPMLGSPSVVRTTISIGSRILVLVVHQDTK